GGEMGGWLDGRHELLVSRHPHISEKFFFGRRERDGIVAGRVAVDEAERQIRVERWADTAKVGRGSLKGIQQGPLFDGHGFERGQHGIVIIPEKEGDMVFDVRMTLRQAVEIREMSLGEGLYARRRIKAEKLDGAAAGPNIPETL